MKCTHYRKQILLADSGELSSLQAAAMDGHLDVCPECREYRRQVEKLTTAATGALPAGVPAPAALAQIRRAAETAPVARTLLFPLPILPSVAYAAALLLLLGAWFAFIPDNKAEDGATELVCLLSMVAEEDLEQTSEGRAENGNEQLKALARQILMMEGLAPDEFEEWDASTPDAAPLPTTLRSRSSGVSPVEKCV